MSIRFVPVVVIMLMTTIGAANATADSNCNLVVPPGDAGETQAHGVILYVYPRTHTITADYDGCQSQWFLDDDHYRKLSVAHYLNGQISGYDNLNIVGDIGYRCHYEKQLLTSGSDRRCPALGRLKIQSYQTGCYSRSKLNSSDSYDVAFDTCRLE